MAFNQFMHPRNIYRSPPDFKELAVRYPEFRKYAVQDLSGKVRVDFKNPDALRALTCILLKKDFELVVEIPKDRLIPTLPLRMNYILWVEDLLTAFPDHDRDTKVEIVGLDIGTGATCIYPLLGNRKNKWTFVATDTDAEAIEYAWKNVDRNGLNDDITVLLVPENASLAEAVRASSKRFDFTMCNPPFFVNETEANAKDKGRKPKSRPPPKATNCHQKHEAITDGGEVAFVKRMIDDSLLLKDTVRLYSTMLGKKQSLLELRKILQELKNDNGVKSIATTEFCQGQTMRWGIAWTYVPDVDLQNVQQMKKVKEKPTKPVGFVVPAQIQGAEQNFADIVEKVEEILLELKMSYSELKRNKNFILLRCIAHENTWSHQRRKRREALRQQGSCSTTANGKTEHNSTSITSVTAEADESMSDAKFTHNTSRDEEPPTKKRFELPHISSCVTKDEEQSVTVAHSSSNEDRAVSNQQTASEESKTTPALESLLSLRNTRTRVRFDIQWAKGSLGRDAVHQVMQYFKNKLA